MPIYIRQYKGLKALDYIVVLELRASKPRTSEPRVSESRALELRALEPKVSEPKVLESKASKPRALETKMFFCRNNVTSINLNIVNSKHIDIAITVCRSDFYYIIYTVIKTITLSIIAVSYMKPRSDQIFFYFIAAINITVCVAYFIIGLNLS